MPLSPNQRLDHYVLTEIIGEGGMGTVWKARDTTLDRDVAIKVLPPEFTENPERLARFEREAKAVAALSHPNIVAIHGFGTHEGNAYAAIELLEGRDLDRHLEEGPLPPRRALEIARQVATGLAAAHAKGIVHRDLKPANVFISPDGRARILDFGLAAVADVGSHEETQLATRTSLTNPGAIMGTTNYMSPEQVLGVQADSRSDIFALGTMLHEMLTGQKPFERPTAAETMTAVLREDAPEITLNGKPAPLAIAALVSRCLEKSPDERFQNAQDLAFALGNASTASGSSLPATEGLARASTKASRLPLVLVALVALVAIAGWALTSLRATPTTTSPGRPTHLSISLPPGMEIVNSIDISSDGRRVVFCARKDGDQQIYVRSLDGFDLQVLDNSRAGENPTFSPDGKSVVFHSRNAVWRAPVDGGPAARLDRAKWMTADWDEEGSILLSEGVNSSLFRIPAGGGARSPVTELSQDGAYAHVWPQRIPGTNKVLLTTWKSAAAAARGGAILNLDTGTIRQLAGATSSWWTPPARWSASGHLIFEAGGRGLLVLPFDPASDADIAMGDARQLLDNVFYLPDTTRSVFALSDEGTLVYAPGKLRGRRLIWVDEDGTVQPIIGQDDVRGAQLGDNVSLSRDGNTVITGGGQDIVEVDLARSIPRRLAISGGNDEGTVWNSDESRVLFASNRDKRWSIWSVGRSGGADPELVLQRDENLRVRDVAPDGSVLFMENAVGRGQDLLILTPDGDVRPLAASASTEDTGAFSIDGEWVAYDSDLSGRLEVYLTRADGTGTPVQVSVGGGGAPKFGRSGTTLYYRQHRKVLRVGFREGRPVGEAVAVFEASSLGTGLSYDINANETRMIALQVDDESIPRELRVITNFFDVIRDVASEPSRQ